jgi:hypothetical protein
MTSHLVKVLICIFASSGQTPMAFASDQAARYHYLLRCSGCHGVDGEGVRAGGIPDFQNFVGAFASDDDGRTYVLQVPGVKGAQLNDADIAVVMNYVMMTWGGTSIQGTFVPFTAREVAQRRARPVTDIVAMRRHIVQRLASQGIATAEYPWP